MVPYIDHENDLTNNSDARSEYDFLRENMRYCDI
jgi:hypothetical protein